MDTTYIGTLTINVPGGNDVLGPTKITENGTFVPETGVTGFNSVEVKVSNSYSASDEGKVVYNKKLINQISKTITKNGVYNITTNNQVVVNVKGGPGSADNEGKPNTTPGSPSPGGARCAVVGSDPETGNDVAVGVDENGNLVQTPVPSGIKIVTPPTKTNYIYQEDMDYSGLVVKMINRDGTTFTDVGHPNGYLAVGELVLPVEKAPAGSGQSYGDWSADPSWVCDTANAYLGYAGGRQYYKSNNGPAIVAFIVQSGDGWKGPILISDVLEDTYHSQGGFTYPPTYTWENKTFYANSGAHVATSDYSAGGLHEKYYDVLNQDVFNAIMQAANVHVNGSGSTGVTIPVKWLNPYTGDTHQDTFEITSTPASGDAHTSTGSSGVEGSGGGGTF